MLADAEGRVGALDPASSRSFTKSQKEANTNHGRHEP